MYQHVQTSTVEIGAASGWNGDKYRIVRTQNGACIVWVSVWDTPIDAAQFVDALGQAVGRRYKTSAPSVAKSGVRKYAGSGRSVVITPREIGGRNVVIYIDVPAGASSALIDPARIT